jgi:hypothetical protein
MKLEITSLKVAINQYDGRQIINALNSAISDFEEPNSENRAAYELRNLLTSCFENQVTGVHEALIKPTCKGNT